MKTDTNRADSDKYMINFDLSSNITNLKLEIVVYLLKELFTDLTYIKNLLKTLNLIS